MSDRSSLSRPIDVIFNTCKKRAGQFLQKGATQRSSAYNVHVFYECYNFFSRGYLGSLLRIYFGKTVVQRQPWQQNLVRQRGDSGAIQAWVGTGLKVNFIAAWNPAGLQRPRIPWLPQPANMQLVPPAQESREIHSAVDCQPCNCRNLSLLQVKGIFSTLSSPLWKPSDTVRTANYCLAGKQQTW